ncbi:hypothetical protein AB833_17205 [Chromatiales bacterium (ex Bugula neritina AB1)]|nr:hypothetical protein AB833_17205 [Chromatiales bacterium (ex Bugula neritina AB1)]
MYYAAPRARDEIIEQLDLILRSEDFKKSPRLRKFLKYVVFETIDKEVDTIRSYVIAVEVFNKGSSFDPGDPYVRNIARLVRAGLKSYYQREGSKAAVRIDVPAGNYIATFAPLNRVEAEPAVVNDPSAVATLPVQSDIDLKPLATTAFAESGMGGLLPTVAVVPMRFLGTGDSNESVIGEVLASNVIAGLSKSSHLNVISRLSTSQFRESEWQLNELVDQLNADYAVSGSYRCAVGKIWLAVEIADCRTLEVIWADELQCAVDKLLMAEDDVVDEVIQQASRVVLYQEIRRAAVEPMADLALHTKLVAGIRYMHNGSPELFNTARNLFSAVFAKQPDHPTVHALLAQWYMLKLNRSGSWSLQADMKDKSNVVYHCERALERNPGHPLGLTMLGLIETHMNLDPDKGLEIYNRAAQLNPNEPLVYACKAAALSYKEHGDEAIESANKAFKLSPIDPQLHLFHTCAAAAHYAAGNINEAAKHANSGFELNPNHASNLRTLVAVQVDQGDLRTAKKTAERLLCTDPGFTTKSYLSRSPNAAYPSGRKIAMKLEAAGVPRG